MQINTSNIVSISEANQNFSKIARLVDENGATIILKNNAPKYVILDFAELEKIQGATNKYIEDVAAKVLADNLEAFKELAK